MFGRIGPLAIGVLLAAAYSPADVVVDDFLLVTGQNSLGGTWTAESDQWPTIGGSSRVLDISTQADLVMGEGCKSGCYPGHNIFKAYVEKASAAHPQYGWRYVGTGALERKAFSLKAGVENGIAPRWPSPTAEPLNLGRITQLRFDYEGRTGMDGSSTPAYDTLSHRLSLDLIVLKGSTCKVTAELSTALRPSFPSSGISLAGVSTARRIRFRMSPGSGPMTVTLRNIAGAEVAKTTVHPESPEMDASRVRKGLYLLEARNGRARLATVITLL